MNKLSIKFQLSILLLAALLASCSSRSTPNKLTKGDVQFAIQSVVNPGTLHSTKEAATASLGDKVTPNLEILKYRERRTSGDTAEGWYVVEKAPIITGGDIQYARAERARFGGGYIVAFKLNPKATEKFREWTNANSGSYLAVVLDGVVISAALVKSEISNGDGYIDGNFTKEEAEKLSVNLRPS